MKKYLLLILITFLVSVQAYSQVRCAFDDILEAEFALDPSYKISVNEVNDIIQQQIQRQKMSSRFSDNTSLTGGNTVYIPVVFHIINNGGSEGAYDNPSDASVISTVDYLNKVYDGTWNGDGGSILGVGDINIKFVLATKDPDNNSTTGINRVNASGVGEYSSYGLKRNGETGIDEQTLKNLSRWDPFKYYNIWVVHEIDGCGGVPNNCASWTGGFAYFPYEPVGISSVSVAVQRDRDGTVMLATGMAPGNALLPHEIGHALNLYHPFQGVDANNACPPTDPTQGDLCADTDPINNPQGLGNQYSGYARDASPYTLPNPNICANGIAYNEFTEKNFMNYTFTTRLFTPDQKDRMKASTMSTIREGLSTSWANNRGDYPTTWIAPRAANVTPVTGSLGLTNYFAGIYRVELNDMIVNSLVTKEDGGYLDNTTKWYDLFSIEAGSTYTMNVNLLNSNNNQLGVYIDYNNDGVFNETTEKIFLNTNIPVSEGVGVTLKKSITFTVPASSGMAIGSIVRMRVINDLSSIYGPPAVSGSSSTLDYGQAEDYPIYLGSNNIITFDANGGEGTMEDQTFAFNASANLTVNAFTRTGYTFAGWNTAADGSGTSYADEASYTMSVAADVTLYAQWSINTYVVQFNTNGGSGSMPDQSITYLASANLSANNYIIWKTGATFSGWNTAPDGSGTAYENGQSFTMSAAANVTLYARWISSGGGGTQLFVRLLNTIKNSNSSTLNTVTMTLDADSSTSMDQFKQNIAEFTNVLPENQILVYQYKILENGRTLADYNIQNESLLKMVAVNLYPSSYLLAGGNTTLNTVMPDGTVYSNATATTTPNFMGALSIDVASGEVTIQNASPAGTYIIQVEKNYVNENNVTLGVQRQTFNLTVYDAPVVQGSFNAPVNASLVVNGIKTQSGNFNNDNILDIITLTENELICGLGNGQGGFVNTITSFNLLNPLGIQVLDFNNDGVNDVIVFGVDNSLVFAGNNSGGFTEVNQLTINNPNTFSSSDFNNDGYIDLAVNSYAVVNHYLGDGTGSFTFTSSLNLSATPSAISYNDVNNDGNVDVLVANKNIVTTFLTPSDKGTVSVRLGDGAGNFTTGYEIPVDYKPTALVIDDFNGDGFKDFASTSEVNGNVSIKFGDGTGNFTGNTQVIVGDNPGSIVIGNFNGDCFPDLAVANTASNTVSIRYGDNLGNFSGTTNIAVGASPKGLIIGDFNSDGLQDLFVENTDTSLSSILTNTSLLPMPVIDFVLPSNGVPGDTVTISGAQFGSSPTVTIGGVSMTVVSNTLTSIDVVLPSGINGGDIVVSNSCGQSLLGSPYLYGTTTYTYNNGWLTADPTGVSLSADMIIVEQGDVILASDTNFDSLTIAPGASVTVGTGVTITASTAITLASTSSLFSSLIVDGVINGTVTYNRYTALIGSQPTGTNDLIAAPLVGQAFGDFAAVNPNLAASGNIRAFAPYNTTAGAYQNYNTVTNATTPLTAGIGYRAATVDGSTLAFTGLAHATDVLGIVLSDAAAGNAWNLIGNPYPSYLDFGSFFELNKTQFNSEGVYQAIYGYDGDASNGWTVWNAATIADPAISELIAPGQAFFVKSKVGGGLVDFTTAMRRTGRADDFIIGRTSPLDVALASLRLSSATNTATTSIYFIEGTTRGLDVGYDAATYGGSAPEFSIVSYLVEANTGLPMAIQSLPYSALTDIEVPLGVNSDATVSISISLDPLTTQLPQGIEVYLEDRVAHTFTLLNTTSYNHTPPTDLSGVGRYYLRFGTQTLGVGSTDLEGLQIYTESSLKTIVIAGQLYGPSKAYLYDLQGRLVFSQALDVSRRANSIDASKLSDAVYVIKVVNDQRTKTQKLVIKN